MLGLIENNKQLTDSGKNEIENSIKELERVEQLESIKIAGTENDMHVLTNMLEESIHDL